MCMVRFWTLAWEHVLQRAALRLRLQLRLRHVAAESVSARVLLGQTSVCAMHVLHIRPPPPAPLRSHPHAPPFPL